MRVPLLNFEGGPGVLLLNFEGGPGVPLLNFRGVPGPTFKLWGGSRGPGPTFTPCRILSNIWLILICLERFMTFNIIWQKLIIEARALATDYVIIQKTMSPRKSEEDVMIKFFKS